MRELIKTAKRNVVLARVISTLGDAWRSMSVLFSDDRGLGQLKSSRHPAARKILKALELARTEGIEPSLRIEPLRSRLIQIREPLVAEGAADVTWDKDVTVSEAARVSKPPRQALLLHGLAREFSSREALELGTNVGISSAYIASAVLGKVWSLDASKSRVFHARQLHAAASIENVEITLGLFDETLEGVLSQVGALDFAFIDGNHQLGPTLGYFERIIEKMRPGGVVVFDDIHWSQGMKAAWRQIRIDDRLSLTVDLSDLGIGVVRSEGDPIARYGSHSSWRRGGGPSIRNPY